MSSRGGTALLPERLIMDAVSNTLAWRKVGIVFWSVVLYKYNGIRYYARIGLLAIDVTIFTLAFISTEWYQEVIDPENGIFYQPEKEVKYGEILFGRFSWAMLVTFLYHAYARAEYHLFLPSVLQRRMFRLRQAVPRAAKASITLLYKTLPYVLALASLYILFLGVSSTIGFGLSADNANRTSSASTSNSPSSASTPASPPSSGASPSTANINMPVDSQRTASGGKSGSSLDFGTAADVNSILRPRQRSLPASQLLKSGFTTFFRLVGTAMSQMELFSPTLVCLRFFQLLCVAFTLEMTWYVVSIIFTERFSFDPLTQGSGASGASSSRQGRSFAGDLLLKSTTRTDSIANKKKVSQWEQLGGRTTPLLTALTSFWPKSPYITSLAIQDLADLTYHHPERRMDLYNSNNIALAGGDAPSAALDILCNFIMDRLHDLQTDLDKANNVLDSQASLGEDNRSENKGASASSSGSHGSSSFNGKAMLQTVLSLVTKARRRLDAAIRRVFDWARPASFDLSLSASLIQVAPSPLLHQTQIHTILLVKALSSLLAHSVKEDRTGTVASSNLIPSIIAALLDLYIRLEKYAENVAMTSVNKRLGNPEKNVFDGHFSTHSFSSSLLQAVSEALYQITTTYYEHLTMYEFSPAHTARLQRFMDFAQ